MNSCTKVSCSLSFQDIGYEVTLDTNQFIKQFQFINLRAIQ